MTSGFILTIATFGAVGSLVLLLATLFGYGRGPIATRLADLFPTTTGQSGTLRSARSVVPSLGTVLMPQKASNLQRIRTRLIQAGFYRHHVAGVFFGVKLLLMVSPVVVGAMLYGMGLLSLIEAILYGALVGLIGTVAPSLWIQRLKAARQKKIRRAMPDALDVIVVCLEGGLSVPAAFARVTSELYTVHPLLAAEMAIVRKEVELGRSTGEALQCFADRFDTEDLQSMAAVVTQAERFGASLVRTLRIQADGLRLKRHQHAEAQAQKAPLKLIFPTVLCIFPALYIVLMGPAAVHFFQMLDKLGQ